MWARMGFRIDENFTNKIDFIELPVAFQSGAITTVFRRLSVIRDKKKESHKIPSSTRNRIFWWIQSSFPVIAGMQFHWASLYENQCEAAENCQQKAVRSAPSTHAALSWYIGFEPSEASEATECGRMAQTEIFMSKHGFCAQCNSQQQFRAHSTTSANTTKANTTWTQPKNETAKTRAGKKCAEPPRCCVHSRPKTYCAQWARCLGRTACDLMIKCNNKTTQLRNSNASVMLVSPYSRGWASERCGWTSMCVCVISACFACVFERPLSHD